MKREELLEELDKAVGIKTVAYEQIREMIQKKPIVTMEFVEMLRDRLMAIPIREYYIPNRRKVIAEKIKETFIKHGVEVI